MGKAGVRVWKAKKFLVVASRGFAAWLVCVSGDGGTRAVGAGDWRAGAKIARGGSRASTRDRRIDRPRSHASAASSPTARVFERTPIARVRVLTVGKSIGSAVARTSAAFEGCIRSNSTTRPPLSPVARCSPVLSNSTALIMSAVGDRGRTGVGRSASVIAAAWKSDIHRGCRVGWVGARVSLSLVLLTVLHLLAGRALAEHLAEVPIQLPEGLARGRHLARASALPTLSPPPSAQAPQRRLPRACFFPARLDAVTGPAVTCERRRLDVRGGRRCLHARVDASRRAEWRRPGRGVVTRRVLSPDRRRGHPKNFCQSQTLTAR